MNKLIYFFTFLAFTVNAQIINLNISDFETNLSLDDADIYFKNSTKNFVSDNEGKATIDLENVNSTDELIVAKKDYQNAVIKVSDLKSNLNIKLEKVTEIELKEAFVTNVKAEDILQKVIDNYDKNYNVEKHYYLVNFQQDLLFDSIDRDYIDVDLQFKFNRDNLKIKSKGNVNNELKSGREPNTNIRLNYYLESIYLKDKYLLSFLRKINEKSFLELDLSLTKYADTFVYEIYLKTKTREDYLIIDKNTFAVIEYSWDTYVSDTKINSNEVLREAKIMYKYRPHQGNWILKETSAIWNTTYQKETDKHELDMKFNVIVNDYSNQSFPKYSKSVNEKMDIRRSFK